MLSEKKLTELRGPQRRISRLLHFHAEAYVHVLFYRILIPLSILYGIAALLYLLVPELGGAVKVMTALVWVLLTPQFFEVAKGLALSWSRGMAFGHLNEEFAHVYRKKYYTMAGLYVVFPYALLAVWVAGFAVMLLRWYP